MFANKRVLFSDHVALMCVFVVSGVWRVLLVALVRAQPEGRQGQPAGVLRHRRDVPVLAIPGARALPVGGYRGRQGSRPRIRAIHGRRLEDDHHRRRVSVVAFIVYVCCSTLPNINSENVFDVQRGPGDLDGREHSVWQNRSLPDVQQSAAVSIRRF